MTGSTTTEFSTIEQALDALRAGRPVLALDDAHRENEGDVILAADTLTDPWMAWTIRHSSGYICAPMLPERADLLALPLMVPQSQDPRRTAYTITVDAASGVSTGISAADRAHTIRTLAASDATSESLIRPGHVLPLRARPGGVLERPGHTEAAVDLCRLAGLTPVAAIGEMVNDDGTMMRTPEVLALGEEFDLPVITIADLVAWRQRHDRVSERARTRVPLDGGVYQTIGYLDMLTGAEHIALISPHGLGVDGEVPLVRVHSECLTGDVFGSLRCDCGPQLQEALRRISERPGAVIYLRGHEGRGIGLLDKLRAYALQDAGADTVDAQLQLGLPVDDREYGAAAGILHALGVLRVRLLSNNPEKRAELVSGGIDVVEVEPIELPANPDNVRYLRTKRDRMGHTLTLDQTIPDRASRDRAPLDPTPLDPTPLDPTPLDHTPLDPTPLDPTPLDHTTGGH
ncbi:MAG: 3,4-dihydroxy-2-butanone-4-phosphate synthase [Propionibacterium sp.]|nr:3,4-dihydroxy-2-butanone-4-phosphate synthase [Propionibacterium sp.]